jgi:hypothetical protein
MTNEQDWTWDFQTARLAKVLQVAAAGRTGSGFL